MSEWTINIETAPGRVTDGQAEALASALEEAAAALGPAVSLDLETGVAGAIYQVEAADYPAAITLAIRLWLEAQEAAGISPTMREMQLDVAGDPRAA